MPPRARTRARTGVIKDEQARQSREVKIAAARRSELDQLAAALIGGVEGDRELRYIVDVLRDRLRQPVQDRQTRLPKQS